MRAIFPTVALTLMVAGAACRLVEEPEEEEAGATAPIRALVVVGGHSYDVEQFPALFQGHNDIEFVIQDSPKRGPFAAIDDWSHDVVVLYNFNQDLSEAEQANILELLDRGTGLVVLHHAICAYPRWPEWERIVGATYYLEPREVDGVLHERSVWKHDVDMRIHVEDPEHPITRGMGDFRIHDETYGKWDFHPGSHLLLTTDSESADPEIAWSRRYRNSRIVFLQLGHDAKAYQNENFHLLVGRSIRRAAGRLP